MRAAKKPLLHQLVPREDSVQAALDGGPLTLVSQQRQQVGAAFLLLLQLLFPRHAGHGLGAKHQLLLEVQVGVDDLRVQQFQPVGE